MQREARAHFRVVRINRWSLALVLGMVLALLLLSGGRQRAALPSSATVRQGVLMLGRDFSGKSEAEARAMLEEMKSTYQAAPVAAREARDASGVSYVIPELNGYSLDVDLTWFRLAVAEEGTLVEPATRLVPAPRRAGDFPAAVIRQGNSERQAVALLINVDWGTPELEQMLALLKKRGAKATLFVSGRWAQGNQAVLRRAAADGHEIATHGHDLSTGPADLARRGALAADIARSAEAIRQITGRPVRYYAPHKSEVSAAIVKAAADQKLRTVLYSLDTVDWREGTTPELILATMGRAKAGDLILLHPRPHTVMVLEQALISLQSRGLRPLILSDLLSPEPDRPRAQQVDHQ